MLMGTVVYKDVLVQVQLSCPKLQDMAEAGDATVMQNASSFGGLAQRQLHLLCKQAYHGFESRIFHHAL